MFDLVLRNADYLVKNTEKVVEEGVVAVEDGEIAFAGEASDFDGEGKKEIEAEGKIIIPGLVNSHSHLYNLYARGIPSESAPTSFYEFLEQFWWPNVEDRLNKDRIYYAAKLAAVEMIKSGITYTSDILEAPNAIPNALGKIREALEEVGLRSSLSFEVTERKGRENAIEGIDENLNFIKSCEGSALTNGMLCVHTSFTCSEEILRRVRELATERGAGIQFHLSEGAYEPEYSKDKREMLPVEFYDEIGFLGPDVLASQCVHVTPQEADILKENGVKLSHMPLSNCEVGGGVAPVPDFLERGLTVGLGTDNYINDMFEVMRGAFHIHKADREDPSVMPAETVFDMATRESSKAVMVEGMGTLEEGTKADLVTLEPDSLTPINKSNLFSQIVTYGRPEWVSSSVINGELVMEDRELLFVDEEECKEEFSESVEDFWGGLDF